MTDPVGGDPAQQPSAPGPLSPLHYPCGQCGARLEYSPGTTTLQCPYCGFRQAVVAGLDDVVEEHDYAQWAGMPVKPRARAGAHVLQCPKCGARTETDDISGACPFCGAPVVVEVSADPQIAPEAVVPFALDQRAAQDAVRSWVGSRWFAPNRLKKVGASETMKGTYLPFWTFDAATESDYRGQRGEYYWETESYTDNEGRTQQRQVRRTAWYPASGHVARDFDDVPVPASTQLPADELAGVGPFALEEAAAYQPDYLSGFRTLRYDVEPDLGLEHAKATMAGVITDDCRHDIGGDEQRVSSVDTAYSDIMFKLVLVPIWIAAYLYGGKSFQVLVNGRTGAVVGRRPYSAVKIFFAVLAALVVLSVVVLIAMNRNRA
jgi:DNA-directed RNA polymerase subunit RPC12/RpoP